MIHLEKHPYRRARERREQELADDLRTELEMIRTGPSVFLLITGRPPRPGTGQTVSYYPNPSGKCYYLTVTGNYGTQVPQTEVPPAFWYGSQPRAGQACSISRSRMTQLRRQTGYPGGWVKRTRSDKFYVSLKTYTSVPLVDGPNEPAGGFIPELETPVARILREMHYPYPHNT